MKLRLAVLQVFEQAKRNTVRIFQPAYKYIINN